MDPPPGPSGGAHLTRWLVLVLAAAVAVVSAFTPALSGLGPAALAVRSASGAIFIAAGGVIWRSSGPVRLGWLFVLSGLALCLTNLTLWPGPVATTGRVVLAGYAPFGALLVHLMLAYPTGRLQGRLERAALTCLYVVTIAYMLAQYLVGYSSGQRFCGPIDCSGIAPVLIASDTAERLVALLLLVVYPGVVALVILSFGRRWVLATPLGRRALRPVVVSLLAAFGLALTSVVLRGLQLAEGQTTRVLMASVWGAGVAGVAVGLLFGVLRNRLVMYGMGELVSQLGAEHPVAEMGPVLSRLLGDPSVQLLYAAADGSGFQDLAGAPVHGPARGRSWLPIGDPPMGVVVHDAAVTVDPKLASAIGAALVVLLDNLRLAEQLQLRLQETHASRARITAAADADRRRVERDLHDGAQQHLISSALTVRRARQFVHTAPEQATELLVNAEEQLRTALHEIRDLARGLHPAVLTAEGVGAAVESVLERLPLDVTLTDLLTSRHPTSVETTAYLVVCESLVNVVKHAHIHRGTVGLWQTDSEVVVEVADRGTGGADPSQGSGLRGLADRLAAVNGTLNVTTGSGTGTIVRAEIPSPAPLGAAVGALGQQPDPLRPHLS